MSLKATQYENNFDPDFIKIHLGVNEILSIPCYVLFLLTADGDKLDAHGRHCMFSYLSSLPISVLRSLDTKSNKFYDRTNRLYDAALLTRCYTQHALRPVIDSKINHIRHFIKIPFINKGMDFIDLPSIFRDKSVQSSIPNYFKNCEVPINCYKYNKLKNLLGALYLISIKLFLILISKLVPLTLELARTLNMFNRLQVTVITGNLKIISDSRIRSKIEKGPIYRFPVQIDFHFSLKS